MTMKAEDLYDDGYGDHSGKAAIAIMDGAVTVTVDCVTCGRLVIGPFEVEHLRSIGEVLVSVADKLGAPAVKSEVTRHYEGEDRNAVEEGMKLFDSMPIGDPAKPKKSAWDWLKEKIH